MKDRMGEQPWAGEWPQADTCRMGVPGADVLSVGLVQLWAAGEQALVHSSLEVGGVCRGQLGGRWLLKRGSGWTQWRGPRPVHTPAGPSATCPCKDCLPRAPLQAQHLWLLIYFQAGASFAGGVLCSKCNAHSSWGHGRDQKGQVGCQSFMSPCPRVAVSRPPPPRCVCSVVSMAAACSPCLWCGLCVRDAISVPATQSLCPRHGLRVRGMASVAMTWSLCPWRGSPCQWHGPRGCGTLSVAVVWSPCPWHGGMPTVWSLCPRRGLRGRGMVSVAVL